MGGSNSKENLAKLEELKKREQDQVKRDQDQNKREQELKKRQDELKRREEDLNKREEELNKREEELIKRENELNEPELVSQNNLNQENNTNDILPLNRFEEDINEFDLKKEEQLMVKMQYNEPISEENKLNLKSNSAKATRTNNNKLVLSPRESYSVIHFIE